MWPHTQTGHYNGNANIWVSLKLQEVNRIKKANAAGVHISTRYLLPHTFKLNYQLSKSELINSDGEVPRAAMCVTCSCYRTWCLPLPSCQHPRPTSLTPGWASAIPAALGQTGNQREALEATEGLKCLWGCWISRNPALLSPFSSYSEKTCYNIVTTSEVQAW